MWRGGKRKKEEEGEEVTSSPSPFLSLPLGSDWPMGDRRSPSIGRLRRHPPVERHPCVFSPSPKGRSARDPPFAGEKAPPRHRSGGRRGRPATDRSGARDQGKVREHRRRRPGEGGREQTTTYCQDLCCFLRSRRRRPSLPRLRRRRRRGERQVKGHCAAFPPLPQRERPRPYRSSIGPLLCLFSSPTLLSHFPISWERKGGCQYLHTGPHFCRRKAKALRFYRYSFVLDTIV